MEIVEDEVAVLNQTDDEERDPPCFGYAPSLNFTPIFWGWMEGVGERCICIGAYVVDAFQKKRLLALALNDGDLDRISGGRGSLIRNDLMRVFQCPHPFPLPPHITLGPSSIIDGVSHEYAAEIGLRIRAALLRPEGPEVYWIP
ncbi:hypothetical protein TK90_2657 (plasmid) [Thioalkalivibrio sp. K90mix]|uniref:hypothetical protein n=1 Tax=Thioalkalivibrio sp. (strain K90mix) TaxID=396595 RepID=UPI000195A3AD|nr:hypothetical protein [Thioalkalivibrio sp. K90mix]ADC73144.1 hypothetical protein TK90_2657 [Thioalkalivibrio sp. K90mix]